MRAEWTEEGRRLYLDIEGNAFLYRMVRSIVGTALQVGRGARSVEQFASRFAAADRSLSGPAAAAHGLCLMAVRYGSGD
jgi:tRNA pseudouridine38-40 synthase